MKFRLIMASIAGALLLPFYLQAWFNVSNVYLETKIKQTRLEHEQSLTLSQYIRTHARSDD
jgi:hypothetical protein